MLLIKAKKGARGNADTKIVTNPYCKTETEKDYSIYLQYTNNQMENIFAELLFVVIECIDFYLLISRYSSKSPLGPHSSSL